MTSDDAGERAGTPFDPDALWLLVLRRRTGGDAITAMGAWHVLELMHDHGQSIYLTWGEDTGQWECSWITGGRRFTGVSTAAQVAIILAARKMLEERDAND